MLEMYNLMLVSVESVWERFWSPTDPKNDQNRMVFQKIPLQQGFQYKWTSSAVHHCSFIFDNVSNAHAK